MNDKQYKDKLTGFIKSSKTQRDNCQVLIVEGIRQYLNGGRTTRLSNFFTQSIAVKSIPTVSILAFIKEHANLKYAKNKEGVLMFIKDDKSELATNSLPTELWYEHKKAKHNDVKEIDYSKRLTNDVKKAFSKGVSKQDMIAALLAGGLSISDFLTTNDSLGLEDIAA